MKLAKDHLDFQTYLYPAFRVISGFKGVFTILITIGFLLENLSPPEPGDWC